MSQFKPGNLSANLDRAVRRLRPTANFRGIQSTGILVPASGNTESLEETELSGQRALEADDDASSGALKAALVCTLLFMFFRFSYLHELIGTRIGVDFHLLLILGGLAVLASLLSGSLLVGLGNRIALAWFSFTTCMLFACFFSLWRGGSFEVLYPYLRTNLILVVLIPAVTQSKKSLVQVMKTIGVAGLAGILMGLTANDFRSGRLELSGAGTSVSNSNDYAANLMLLMPPIAYLTLRKGTNIVVKIAGCAALIVGCFLVLSTGSRGALISIALSALYLVKIGSWKLKSAILIGLPLAGLVAIPFLPGEAAARLTTLFSSQKDTTGEAVESQAQRTELLMESLRFTFQHPLLGVGPGTFAEYQAIEAGESGQRGMWHETHNAYTQISSECGIPAAVSYLAAILMTFIVFQRGRKSTDPDVREVCAVLCLMLISFSICMFFLAQGYGFGFPVMGGIAISIDRLLKREQAQNTALALPA